VIHQELAIESLLDYRVLLGRERDASGDDKHGI
jgi:hypothetical protein